MPFDNLPYADQMAKHGFVAADHRAPRFFPVAARRMFDETGAELPGWKRIVREDDGRTLHVATDAYEIVTNEEAFAAFEEAIRSSTLRWQTMQIGTDFSHQGARVFRQYLFPEHIVPVKRGVDVALRILMLNSYDGSLAFRGSAGAFNFVCANTAILGKEVAGFRFKHGKSADVTRSARMLVEAAEGFIEETRRWQEWPTIPVADADALGIFRALPQSTPTLEGELARRWLIARDTDEFQGGANLWALFNVLTAWATHEKVKETARANFAATRHEREVRVQKLLASSAWRKLEDA